MTESNLKKYDEYIIPVFFLLLLIISFLLIKPFFIALSIGALLAYVVYPGYQFVSVKINNKTGSALLFCLIVIIIFVVPALFFVKSLVQESYVLFISVKQMLAVGLFDDCHNSFCVALKNFSHDPIINVQVQTIAKSITTWVVEHSSQMLLSIPFFVLNLFVLFFSMFYFLKDGDIFVGKIGKYLGTPEHKYTFILGRLKKAVHGIVYGYLIMALIQGLLGALGFYLFGISSPLFWGAVMAFFALIPFLGTGVVWVPTGGILILDGIFQDSNTLIFKGVALMVYCFIFVASLDNFLKPLLIGDKANIHPALILLGIMGGLLLLGPFGVIIGPLVLSLTYIFFTEYFQKD